MNRQRLLWVILSVTLLVILILVGGLFLFRDEATVPWGETTSGPRVNFDYFEIPLHRTPLPGMEELEAPEAVQENGDDIVKQDFVMGEDLPENDKILSDKVISREPVVRAKTTPRVVKRKKPSTTVAKKRVPVKRRSGPEYWIQTGSFKSLSKAKECNAVLIENGLSGVIRTKEIDNSTRFRVRVGPYSSKREADKFCSWIKRIDGMEDSYVSL